MNEGLGDTSVSKFEMWWSNIPVVRFGRVSFIDPSSNFFVGATGFDGDQRDGSSVPRFQLASLNHWKLIQLQTIIRMQWLLKSGPSVPI